MERLTATQVRRLALVRAGLWKRELTGLPRRAAGRGLRARRAAEKVVGRFGYLQLDTVSIAGARSHAIVLMSRIDGFDPRLAEDLLAPGAGLFEYWGHEASWIPLDLYPTFAFRRREFRHHPWWGDLIGDHPEVARDLLKRIRDEGPLRSADMEDSRTRGSSGWWNLKLAKKVATALWSSGELAIRERRGFQRSYDLAERVIPDHLRAIETPEDQAIERLVLEALDGHGWATVATISATWRLTGRRRQVLAALDRLERRGLVTRAEAALASAGSLVNVAGWIRIRDLELVSKLGRLRPRKDRGVLLSPFDPILWDRKRVAVLFDFDQVLEIFKPAAQRRYGYYCLPVLAGEHLVARVDLKARRDRGMLELLSIHYEDRPHGTSVAREATRTALDRFASALALHLDPRTD